MRASVLLLASVTLALTLAGCSPEPPPHAPTPTQAATPTAIPPPSSGPFNQSLHDELIAMLDRDQASRTGGMTDESDEQRTRRLREIIQDFGWPTISLVGTDGEDAAWAIAQHSDLDPAFQRFALEHLRTAVDAGEASPGNLAYLEDRVATGEGLPQVYGTQLRCGPGGPEPATPIADRAGLETRRARVGLGSFTDYVADMEAICSTAGE